MSDHTNVVGGKCPLQRYRAPARKVSWHQKGQLSTGTRVYDRHDERHVGRVEEVTWAGDYVVRFDNGVLAQVPAERCRRAQEDC